MITTNKVKVTVGINESVWSALESLVGDTPYRFSALGLVSQNDETKEFIIEDLVFPRQENTDNSTTMDTASCLDIIRQNRDTDEGVRCWIHTCGNTTPVWSTGDNASINSFLEEDTLKNEDGTSWLLSLVINKQGKYRLRLDAKNVPNYNSSLLSGQGGICTDGITITKYYTPFDKDKTAKIKANYRKVATDQRAVVPGYTSQWAKTFQKGNHLKTEGISTKNYFNQQSFDTDPYGYTDQYDFMDSGGYVGPHSILRTDTDVSVSDGSQTDISQLQGVVVSDDMDDSSELECGLPYSDGVLFCLDPADVSDICAMYKFVNPVDVMLLIKKFCPEDSATPFEDEISLYTMVGRLIVGHATAKTILGDNYTPKAKRAMYQSDGWKPALKAIREKSSSHVLSTKDASSLLADYLPVTPTIPSLLALDFYYRVMALELGFKGIEETRGELHLRETGLPNKTLPNFYLVSRLDKRYKHIKKMLTIQGVTGVKFA